MSFQLIFGALPGMFGAESDGGDGQAMVFNLPYPVVEERERIGIREVQQAYQAALAEAQKGPFDFDPIVRCWSGCDTSSIRALRMSAYFDALLDAVSNASDEIEAEGNYRLSLLKSQLQALLGLLERVETIQPRNFAESVHVGPVTVNGPSGTLGDLGGEFDLIRDRANQEIGAAYERATAAFRAIFDPAKAKIEQETRNAVLSQIVPAARQLAQRYGWNVTEQDGRLVFSRNVNGRDRKIEIPLPAPTATPGEVNAGGAPRPATSDCELAGTPT